MGRIACVLGEAPSSNSDPSVPIMSGDSGKRLARHVCVDEEKLRRAFIFRNLLQEFPGQCGKGAAFPPTKARAAASNFRTTKKVVILLGKRLARAFGIQSEYFEQTKIGRRVFFVIPHPSGVNHWWNDRENVVVAREFFRSLINGEEGC